MKKIKNNLAFNVLGFQLGWFACVLSAAHLHSWIGLMIGLGVVTWHVVQAQQSKLELLLIAIVTIFGGLFDQSLLSSGLIAFPQENWPPALLPAWMAMLWMLFTTTLNIGLRWMRNRYWIAIVFGLIGGPMAYIGGQKLGAMNFVQPTALLVCVGIGWAIFMPSLLWLSTRFDGYTQFQRR